ncbi:MAG: N-acetylmuramoyl-L-alanine amidase [Muribaculaceae bacterium]|nr:N-acetylmuramoyl-L-alanine amidase [Muribaculaceae bacterium]
MFSLTADARDFVLIIDAGHGGKDVGAKGARYKEKDVNLAVAKRLAERIKKECKDVKVVMTRDNDTFVSLRDRAKKANDADGDLFISIHVNSLPLKSKKRKTFHGSEVYTLGLGKSEENLAVAMRENSVMSLESDYSEVYQGFDPDSTESYIIFELSQSADMEQSIDMADLVQQALVAKAGRRDIGVKQSGFWVLWATSMPSILIELDFISNPTQEQFLGSAEGQKKLADAIFDAFQKYRKLYPVTDSKPISSNN